MGYNGSRAGVPCANLDNLGVALEVFLTLGFNDGSTLLYWLRQPG